MRAEALAAHAAPAWIDAAAAIASVGTLFVVIVAAILARGQLEEIRRTRHAEAMFILSRRWDDLTQGREELSGYEGRGRELRAAVHSTRGKSPSSYFRLIRVPNFFEDLAIQVKARSIPMDIVFQSFGDSIQHYWSIWMTVVPTLRSDLPRMHENFEYLAARAAAYEKELDCAKCRTRRWWRRGAT